MIAESRNKRYTPLFHWIQCASALHLEGSSGDEIIDGRQWPKPRSAYTKRWQLTEPLRDDKKPRYLWQYGRVFAHYLCQWANPQYAATTPFPDDPIPKEGGDILDAEVYFKLKENGLEHFFFDCVFPIINGKDADFYEMIKGRIRTLDTGTEVGVAYGLPPEVAYEIACDMIAKPLDAQTWGLCSKPAYRAISRLMSDPAMACRLPKTWSDRALYPVTPLIKHITTVAQKWVVPVPLNAFNFRDAVFCLGQLETYLTLYHEDRDEL